MRATGDLLHLVRGRRGIGVRRAKGGDREVSVAGWAERVGSGKRL